MAKPRRKHRERLDPRRRVPSAPERPHAGLGFTHVLAPATEQADRLTLVRHWGLFHLDQPVFVNAGETIKRRDGQLLVLRLDGRVDTYPGSQYR